MQPALDRAVLDRALGQRHRGMGAHVADREHRILRDDDRDRLALHLRREHLAFVKVKDGTDAVETAHAGPPKLSRSARAALPRALTVTVSGEAAGHEVG